MPVDKGFPDILLAALPEVAVSETLIFMRMSVNLFIKFAQIKSIAKSKGDI
jgi:hypothetical protein